MYKEPNIVPTMKKEGWSHLVRMSDDRTIKKVILGKPDGRRKTGGPK
jgi:hypothetical protein